MAAVELSGVHIRFPIYGARSSASASPGSVGGLIGRARHGPAYVEALSDISLRLERGDRVGLVGHNGSGKSTLLRVVAGIYAPCRGTVRVRGRVLSLFDPMLGMTVDCSGRDNVVLRGIYMGLTPAAARARIEEVAEFCELGPYMDLPLSAWSTGMQLRLAFAMATALEPDILLLDEQFLTGDAAFREKAEARLRAFIGRAGIVLQASHSEEAIRQSCNKAILLERGRLVHLGSTAEVFARYNHAPAARASDAA
jgi:ABC-2 type transport system ATP-binding protein/lipopolysaccharide transport system ATP-binding protein